MKQVKRRSCAPVLLLVLLVRSVLATAWAQRQSAVLTSPPTKFPKAGGAFLQKFRSGPLNSLATSDETDEIVTPDVTEKCKIEITSEVPLPFSREVAFDAYSDLRRQPSWSSWLHSVEYTDESKEKSKWTMKFMGIKYSWTAVALKNERPHVIQWQSTSGLRNFGIVQFLPQNDAENPTLMTMKMTFVAPRAAAAVFRRSKAMAKFVKDKMILDSMVNFRNVVLEKDLKDM